MINPRKERQLAAKEQLRVCLLGAGILAVLFSSPGSWGANEISIVQPTNGATGSGIMNITQIGDGNVITGAATLDTNEGAGFTFNVTPTRLSDFNNDGDFDDQYLEEDTNSDGTTDNLAEVQSGGTVLEFAPEPSSFFRNGTSLSLFESSSSAPEALLRGANLSLNIDQFGTNNALALDMNSSGGLLTLLADGEGNQTDIKIGGGVDIQDVNVDGRINGSFNQVVNLINDGLSTGTSLTYFIDGADNVLHTEQRGASNSITLDIQLSQSAFDIRQIDENSVANVKVVGTQSGVALILSQSGAGNTASIDWTNGPDTHFLIDQVDGGNTFNLTNSNAADGGQSVVDVFQSSGQSATLNLLGGGQLINIVQAPGS